MIKFGISEKEITPKLGLNMPGYFTFRTPTEILDPLYVKAMVFDDGKECFVFVVCDAVELYRKHTLEIRRRVGERMDLNPENISVSVTHSHTTGPTWTWIDNYYEDEEYSEFLINQATEAVCEAYALRKNARISVASDTLSGVAFVRRFYLKDGTFAMNPKPELVKEAETEPDETFILLKIEYEDGTLAAFVENFALHADSVGKNVVSADYPGVVARLVREKFGEKVHNVFINSAAGDVNHIDIERRKNGDVANHLECGKRIFDKLCELEKRLSPLENCDVSPKTMYFTVKKRKPTDENYEVGKKILKGEDVNFDGYDEPPEVKRIFAFAAKNCYESNAREIEVEIKTLKLGNVFFAMWPGEVFCEFAKIAREAFKGEILAISAQANNTLDCYVPSKTAFENGGYETRESVELMPDKNAGYEIADNTIKLLSSY
ncbi:MAG: hypothetical protein E7473_11685 [Ruminococcaceae bacterium]|nr:hypothetical protein [Oscillospiraceae bacterium]